MSDRTDDRPPVCLQVTLHAETVATGDIEVVELNGGAVVLKLGDRNVSVHLLGQIDQVRRLIIEADRHLSHL